jgi:hypothetical protein
MAMKTPAAATPKSLAPIAVPPPAPVEPEPTPTLHVRFTKVTALVDGDLVGVGEARVLAKALAERLIISGRCRIDAVRIRLTVPYAIVDGVVRCEGDVVETTEAVAISLYAQSGAEVVDGSIPFSRLPPRQPRFSRMPPPDPWGDQPRVTIRALRATVIPGGSLSPGEEGRVPEEWACLCAHTGAFEILGLAGLSERATRFLRDLKRPYSQYNPPRYHPWTAVESSSAPM